MFIKRQAQIPIINTIIMLFVIGFIMIAYMIYLSQSNNLYIDENKINSQLILNKVLSGSCFLDSSGIILNSKLTQENFNKCFEGLDKNILVKFDIIEPTSNILDKTFYVGGKIGSNPLQEFNELKKFCNFKTTVNCVQMKYPVLIGSSVNFKSNILSFQILES